MKTGLRRILTLLPVLLLCGGGCTVPADPLSPGADAPAVYRAGFGSAEIPLPEGGLPLYIAGYHNALEITEVRDLCRASALWLDAGGEGILLLSVDCVGLGSDTAERIRDRLILKGRNWYHTDD